MQAQRKERVSEIAALLLVAEKGPIVQLSRQDLWDDSFAPPRLKYITGNTAVIPYFTMSA